MLHMDNVVSQSPSFKSRLRQLLSSFGLNVSVTRSTDELLVRISRGQRQPDRSMPPLLSGPLEALYHIRGGKPAAFLCPVAQCVTVNGFNFDPAGWHPFSAALMEYGAGLCAAYSGSLLERYYLQCQPQSAAEALLTPEIAPPQFRQLPSHLLYLFPWSARTPAEANQAVRKWTQDDHIEHTGPAVLDMAVSVKDHGPLDPAIAEFEYRRLTTLYDALKRDGFSRSYGDVRVILIRRGEDFRFLNFGGGLHRTAAMAALGHEVIPAMPLNQLLIDTREVDYWPQVRNGIWTRESALSYIDHLFDFDALSWARQHELATQPSIPDQQMHLAARAVD